MDNTDTLTAPDQPKADLSGLIAGMNQPPAQTPLTPTAGEAVHSVTSGAQNALSEMAKTVGDSYDYVYGRFGVPHNPTFDAVGDAVKSDYVPPSVGGKVIQGASQFGTAMLGVGKLAEPLSFLKSFANGEKAVKVMEALGTTAKGAAADAVGFDPHQARLSNLLQDAGVDNTVVNALAAKPDDTNLQGRFKNAMEGAGLGWIAEGAIKGFTTLAKASKDLAPEVASKVSDFIYNSQTANWVKSAKQNLISNLFKSDDPVVQTQLATMAKPDGTIDKVITNAEDQANVAKSGLTDTTPAAPGQAPDLSKKVEIVGPDKPTFTFSPEQATKVVETMKKPGDLEQIINTSNMQSGEDALRAINATAKVLKDTGRITSDPQTWEQTGQNAAMLGADKKTLFQNLQAIGGSTEDVASHLEAANHFMQGLADKVSKMATRTDLTPAEIEDHVNTINLLANVSSQYRGITKNLGRGLNILRKNQLPLGDLKTLDVNDVLNTPEGRLRYNQMAKLILAQGGDLNSISRLLSPSARRWMAFNEYYINNLLSSPTTTTVNTVGGTMMNLFLPAEKALAGMFKGNMAEVKAAGAMYKGVFDGALDAVRLFSKTQDGLQFDPGPMWKVLRSGQNALDNQNAIDHPSAALDSRFLFQVDPNDLQGIKKLSAQTFDQFGKFVRLPSHAIAASDELLKTMGTRAEMTRQLYLQGYKQGLSGNDLDNFIKNGLANPDKDMWQNAIKYARETSFTQDLPQGGIGRSVQQFVAQHPAARLFIPFVRTPVNIMKFSFSHTPGLNLLVKEARQELKDDPATFMAKMATGTTLYTAATKLALDGKITGAGPRASAEKEPWLAAGNQPYSVKLGNKWVQYNRLDPFASFLGMSADAADLFAKAPDHSAGELGTIMMSAMARNVTSKTFLKGMSDLLTAVADGDPSKFGKVIGNVASGVVPASGFLRTLNRTEFEDNVKETYGLMDKMASQIPGLSDSLPPVRNVWGDPVKVPNAVGPDLLSPFYEKEPTGDFKEKVAQEITRLGVPFGKPDKFIGDPANRFEFSPQQYDRLVQLMGNSIAVKGRNLPETLQDLMNTPLYKNKMTDGDAAFEGTRGAAILRVRQAFLQQAHVQLAKEFPDYNAYRQRSMMMKAATHRAGGDQILQQLSLPQQ